MKSIAELNSSKIPIVIIDNKLDQLDKLVLFPEKVEKSKIIISKIGLPNKRNSFQLG